jgi:DNA-binding transcriptional regulator/RsmH inhibitor MraZ
MISLQGQNRGKVDPKKKRVFVSQSLGDEVGPEAYLFPFPNGSMRVTSQEGANRVRAAVEALNALHPDSAEIESFIIGGHFRVAVGDDGRIRIPDPLLDWMGVSHETWEVVVRPTLDGVEIWSAERWADQKRKWTSDNPTPRRGIERLFEKVFSQDAARPAADQPTQEQASEPAPAEE